jgi:hypothetical protein
MQGVSIFGEKLKVREKTENVCERYQHRIMEFFFTLYTFYLSIYLFYSARTCSFRCIGQLFFLLR